MARPRGTPNLTIDVRAKRVVDHGGLAFARSPQQFDLYLLLAARRRSDPTGGDITLDEVARLPSWRGNASLRSIGKQISRHMQRLGSRNLIHAVTRTGGPYRLTVTPSQIHLSASAAEVADLLCHPSDTVSPAALYRFNEALGEGDACLDAGQIEDALRLYEHARQVALSIPHQVLALVKLLRGHEGAGHSAQVRSMERRLLALRRRPDLGPSLRAVIDVSVAWAGDYHARQDYRAARRRSLRALQSARPEDDRVRGHAFNLLGLTSKRLNRFDAALRFFCSALEHWTRAEYPLGLSFVYANLGTLYHWQADRLRRQGKDAEARPLFAEARLWALRNLELCRRSDFGADTAVAEIILTETCFELSLADPRHAEAAWAAAFQAHGSASRARSRTSAGQAATTLAKLSAGAHDREAVSKYLAEADRSLRSPAHRPFVKEARARIQTLLAGRQRWAKPQRDALGSDAVLLEARLAGDIGAGIPRSEAVRTAATGRPRRSPATIKPRMVR